MRKEQRQALRGSILGAFAADAAGATLEFLRRKPTPPEVQEAMEMTGGGILRTAPGQITDDSELALSLMHALARRGSFDIEAIAVQYQRWLKSPPFDIGGTTRAGLEAEPEPGEKVHEAMWRSAGSYNTRSKSNGGLMRVSPLGVWGVRLSAPEVVQAVRQEHCLTHCHTVCQDCGAAYVLAIRHLVLHPGDSEGAFSASRDWVQIEGEQEVLEWIEQAAANEDVGYEPDVGFVKYGFVHAFRHLKQRTPYEESIAETLRGGGDTDTNACIVGGLVGALHGEESIPERMRAALFSCDTSLCQPRPEWLQTRKVLKGLLEDLCRKS